jgi:tetratricopeptide (TPR) repeat protein
MVARRYSLLRPLLMLANERMISDKRLGLVKGIVMSNVVAMYAEAEKLKDNGNHVESIEVLQKILEIDPKHVLAHLTLGRLYTLTGQHELAIAHNRKACELEPSDSFNFSALSVTCQRAYAGTGDHKYIQMAEDAMAHARSLNH